MNPKIIEPCFKAADIEKFVLSKQEYTNRSGLNILTHFNCCNKCSKRYIQVEIFHVILDDELNKPVSKQILNLVEGLQNSTLIENEI